MVGARSSNRHSIYTATSVATNLGRWISVASATAALIGLSICNAMQSSAFDGVRAGAYLLRTRRGSCLPLIRVESRDLSFIPITRLISLSSHTSKEDIYVRR